MKIHAIAIDETHIYLECKSKKCNSDGIHRHGSCGDLTNRETSRCSHCSIDYDTIIIDDATFRGTLTKIIKKGKNKGKYILIPNL